MEPIGITMYNDNFLACNTLGNCSSSSFFTTSLWICLQEKQHNKVFLFPVTWHQMTLVLALVNLTHSYIHSPPLDQNKILPIGFPDVDTYQVAVFST
jgi:hypothetical protein